MSFCEKNDTSSVAKTGISSTTGVAPGQAGGDDNGERERAERFFTGEESTCGQPAVADVSLRLYEGEIFVLLGPNGAGKSSLMNVISGKAISFPTICDHACCKMIAIQSAASETACMTMLWRLPVSLENSRRLMVSFCSCKRTVLDFESTIVVEARARIGSVST